MSKIVVWYHSSDWQILLSQKEKDTSGVYGWTTWSVDNGWATLVWTRF